MTDTRSPQVHDDGRVAPCPGGMAARVLILSNGHGEDAMAALLGRALQERHIDVAAFPLVGEGRAYRAAGIPIVGVQQVMPSGGFILEGSGGALWRDIQAGLLRLTWQQIRTLRTMARDLDWVIGVGDIYPLSMNALFMRRPCVFVPTAKSDYIRGHYAWEAALMRRTCSYVFPRDLLTAQSLQVQGVPARYLGNLMMDALNMTGRCFGQNQQPVVGVLPGSREPEVYQNTAMLLDVAHHTARLMGDQQPLFVLALAGGLSQTHLAAAVNEQGWQWQAAASDEVEHGIMGCLSHRSGCGVAIVARGCFGDVLANSQVVLGMSGTGNEQAAGLGIPVVTLPGPGPQFTRHFAGDQKRLLGEAVCLVEDGSAVAAQEVYALLQDKDRCQAMGRVGRERMGEPGATQRMADCIVSVIRGRPQCE